MVLGREPRANGLKSSPGIIIKVGRRGRTKGRDGQV
jgi:hypothetical protein